MKNIPFVKEDEVIIIICEDEKSDAYEGIIDQVEEVLEYIEEYETVQKILRLDLTTLHAEDVSEQLADAYVANYEMDEQDIQLQPFVLNSDAYHVYLDQKAAREYEDNLYGSYEKQHRLRPCDVLDDYWW
ncbi:agmatine/peptidylarginine deiminase [Bartonella japonica]|uniref:Agmatine/peptidylarginine deiminase n=1 Tax=Bartonella japonica TaxID=357761 RepID=A0ABV2FPX6_9HYPH